MQISFDWVLNAAQGLLAAGWAVIAWLYTRLHTRVLALEENNVESLQFERVANDVELIKRVLYAIAHKLDVGTMAESLNGRDT